MWEAPPLGSEGPPCPAGQVRPQENDIKRDVDLELGDIRHLVRLGMATQLEAWLLSPGI